ncbi:MAG TPA: hypothetical protein VK420_07780, partial [Longimicrobium sp.]|nr:hypothetical protein [Longimicrobium sp.]
VQGGRLVSIAAGRAPVQVPVSDGAQGLRFDVPVEGPWTLLLAGFVEQDAEHGIRCWEGRAAVLVPSWALELEAPARVRPADEVALTLRGRPGASAWVAVRDARLSARGPSEAAAVALRQGLEASLERFADGYLKATLSDFFPRQYRSRGICYDALDDDSYSGRSEEVEELLDGAPGRGSRAAPKQDAPSMSDEPPAVVLCQAITFDAEGVARASFRAPPLLGQLEVDVLGVVRGDWASARAAISVHQAVHGELLLPRYVFAGDRATGTLHVRSESEPVEVEVRRDGTPLLLHEGRRNATRLTVSAPGGEVRFDASPGDFEVTLRMRHGEARRVVGRVDQPGRATWRQCSVVAVPAGGRLEVEGARALARVLPGVGATALRMSRALQDYAFSCAEQTAAILLASVTELLLDTDRRRELARHVSGAVERLRSMALPSGFFRAYPNRDVSPWLSKAAAAHLLELESVEPRSSLEPVWPDLQRALGMARKGAQAHGLERAPAQPRTTREALACVSRNPERTRELAEQVRAGMGTWQGRVAVLRLGAAPVGGAPEAPRSAAEIRAETAYGAAVLLRAGPELLTDAAPLIRTVLGGLEESGRCFSTLDTVAALALLGALPQGG